MTIIVNGESYIKREEKKRNIPKSVAKAMILAEMFGSYDGYGKKYERKLQFDTIRKATIEEVTKYFPNEFDKEIAPFNQI